MKINQKGSMADLGLVIIVLVVLFFLWLLTGGSERPASNESPFFQTQEGQPIPNEVYKN